MAISHLLNIIWAVEEDMESWAASNNSDAKRLFHVNGKKLLKMYAKEILKLTPDQFEVRSCLGGPAVLGEVILHTDNIYVQIHQSLSRNDNQRVMFRKCDGRKDYCGKTNNYTTLRSLEKNNLMEVLDHLFYVMA
jgi:hypothetical protein